MLDAARHALGTLAHPPIAGRGPPQTMVTLRVTRCRSSVSCLGAAGLASARGAPNEFAHGDGGGNTRDLDGNTSGPTLPRCPRRGRGSSPRDPGAHGHARALIKELLAYSCRAVAVLREFRGRSSRETRESLRDLVQKAMRMCAPQNEAPGHFYEFGPGGADETTKSLSHLFLCEG